MNKQPQETLEERLDRSSKKVGDCIEWTGYKDRQGYGTLKWHGRMVKAHRMAYLCKVQGFPDSLCVLHRCDNPSCINPEHLFLGTPKDNNLDKINKGRNPNHKGLNHPSVKLSEKDVLEIWTFPP